MSARPMRQILIVGDSHTAALERGRQVLAARGALPEGLDWRIAALGSGTRMNIDFWAPEGTRARIRDANFAAQLPAIPPDGMKPDAIGLSMALWSGRVMRELILAGAAPFGSGLPGRPLSAALMRRLVSLDQQHILGLARFLKGQGIPVFVIEPPGIFRDYRLLLHIAPADAVSLQAHVRGLQAAELAQAGIPILPLAPDVYDADGFMRSALRHEDPTDTHHANDAFGEARLLEIAAFLRDSLRPVASLV